jgi:hypothetical protein
VAQRLLSTLIENLKLFLKKNEPRGGERKEIAGHKRYIVNK